MHVGYNRPCLRLTKLAGVYRGDLEIRFQLIRERLVPVQINNASAVVNTVIEQARSRPIAPDSATVLQILSC